jgi:hypothetical protein
MSLYAIFYSTSSTAGIGMLFVPFEMFFGAVAVASLALLVVSLIYLGREARRIQSFYNYQHADHAEALTIGAAGNLLSAIATNVKTPPTVLDISRNPDPGLHRKRHGWIEMFDRDELAVVRKVLRSQRSPVKVLSILARSADDYVLADVCADKLTPSQSCGSVDPHAISTWFNGVWRTTQPLPWICWKHFRARRTSTSLTAWHIVQHAAPNPTGAGETRRFASAPGRRVESVRR